MLFFGLVYAAEGLCQPRGLISQPLIHYVKEEYAWSSTLISSYMSIFSLPWIIKPLFGIVSDFVPFLGYRRKSYLLLTNIFAVVAYLVVSRTISPAMICGALLVSFFGMAVSSTVCGALLVENGQRLRLSSSLVNQQWLWLSIAAIVSAALGGWLTQHLTPASAVHCSALFLLLGPFAVIFGSIFLMAERKVSLDRNEAKKTLSSVSSAIRSGRFLVIGMFLFLYMYSPGLYVPLYFHMTNNLHFTQQFIGMLGSVGAIGSVAGAVLHRFALSSLTTKAMLNLSILLGTLAALSYLLLTGETSAVAVYFVNGVIGTITIIVSATLAVDYCPPRSEGFSFAILASIENLSIRFSDVSGSFFYDHFFSRQFAPLVIISAGFTALAFAFVPLLRLGQKNQGHPGSEAKVPAS